MSPVLSIAVAALLPGTSWVFPVRPLKDPLVAEPHQRASCFVLLHWQDPHLLYHPQALPGW